MSKVRVVIASLAVLIYLAASFIINIRIQRDIAGKMATLSAEEALAMLNTEFDPQVNRDRAKQAILAALPQKVRNIKTEVVESWKPYSYLITVPFGNCMTEFEEYVYGFSLKVFKGNNGNEVHDAPQSSPSAEDNVDLISRTIMRNYALEIRIQPTVIAPENNLTIPLGTAFPVVVRMVAEAGPEAYVLGRAVIESIQWIDTDRSSYKGYEETPGNHH